MATSHIKMADRKLSFEFVLEKLKKMSALFTPPLSESLDIEEFARKLSCKAEFVVCTAKDETIGFTAYYLNSAARQIYITLICVDADWQAHGIGGKMLSHIAAKAVEQHDETIALEVNKQNENARRFYLRQGFTEQEDRGKKLLMTKTIQ